MDDKEIEEIYNQTFPGLAFFSRDTNLSESLIERYYVGQILLERGFTDMTFKRGGLTSSTRYLIASANGRDVSSIVPEAELFGLVILKRSSHFKVLDIHRHKHKVQILLLEIPGNALDFFSRTKSNIEEKVIKMAREDFDKKWNAEPIAELQSKEWVERTAFPIGMNDSGDFFLTD